MSPQTRLLLDSRLRGNDGGGSMRVEPDRFRIVEVQDIGLEAVDVGLYQMLHRIGEDRGQRLVLQHEPLGRRPRFALRASMKTLNSCIDVVGIGKFQRLLRGRWEFILRRFGLGARSDAKKILSIGCDTGRECRRKTE